MSTRRPNRALSTTRRWTAGALLASTLAVGGLGVHLADAYAATQSDTLVAVSTTTPTSSATTSTTPAATSSAATTTSALGTTSSSTGSTTTKGS